MFVSISIKGPYYPVSCKSIKGPYYPTLICFWESMWSCAIPHPKVVQSIPCTCSALEYQLHWGDTSRRHLYSTQVYSTQLAFPLGKRRRTEEKVTLLAKLIDLPYINVMYYKYYVSGFGAHGCGSCLSNEQLTVICDNPQYFSYDLIWFWPWLLFNFKLPFFQSLIAHL